MAFQFIPPFEEGDRQTNDETGVEYIFTDGAWRPLGPKIEDEFDTLDNRYVKSEGTTALGNYYRLRGPNVTGDGVSTFQVIDEGVQKLYNVATPSETNTAWVANVEYVNNAIEALDSASIEYVDDTVSDYLPLAGGDMTGAINIDRPSNQAIVISKDGQENLKLWVDGTVSTTKTTFSDDNFVTKAYVDSNTSTDSMNINGDNVVTTSWKVLGSGRTFIANSNNELGLYRLKAPSESHHAARKQDVDNHKAKARTGTSTSPTLSTGELYYNTSTKQLFIGE